jgi:hypothetical protein
MIGQIKNIRFTYQWGFANYSGTKEMGGHSGWLRSGAAAQKGASAAFLK